MSTLMPDPPAQLPPVSLAERDDIRRSIPMSELVLVDRYEAQGWRVRKDERLDRLFEERCDWVRTYGRAGQLAVDSAEQSLTYDQLDAQANKLARFLRLRGANAGDRIGLLLDRPADAYRAILAVLKIGAAYVPMDPSSPAHRMATIVEDAQVRTVLSVSDVAERVERMDLLGAEIVRLDRALPLINEQKSYRLTDAERGVRDGSLAYISYRPGPDGRPTGVAVDHRSVCNFVKVAAEMYGIRPWDRVYQGVPIAYDFSVEEIWVPWAVGATLVPRPAGVDLRGRDLHAFLSTQLVTAMSCVPDLLATLEHDLPNLRFLLVAGQACPQDLVRRWHKPGRRFLSVYGPAEATVSAAWTELHPDKRATIGIPLPTYSTVVLDAADPFHALPHGQVGEIGIAGIGLNCGYLNRDDLTEKIFIPDFLGIPANPSGRIFRTGDLGRVNPDGEIEYHGRLDGQQPASGFRAELDEIGSVVLPAPETPVSQTLELPTPQAVQLPVPQAVELPVPQPVEPPTPQATPLPVPQAVQLPVPQPVELPVPQAVGLPVPQALALPIPQAASVPVPFVDPDPTQIIAPVGVVDLVEPPTSPAGGSTSASERELAGLLAEVIGAEVPVDANFFDDLGADSMVMARFCARLRKREDLPSVAMKDVYANPSIAALARAFAPASGSVDTGLATELATVLAEVIGAEVPVDANFFDDLGADSMVMARFCARLRKREDLPSVAMKDVYANPTIASLATAFGTPAAVAAGSADSSEPPLLGTQILRAVRARTVRAARHRQAPTRKQRYLLCGALQLLFLVAYPALTGYAVIGGVDWIAAGPDLVGIYLRSVVVGVASFVGLCGLPVLLKWVLVGRWKPQEVPVWSLAYFRFWVVKTLVQRSPMALFVGTPLYVFYLRLLGAKVGRGVAVFSKNVPVCTDMLTLGDGAVIMKDSFFSGYRAHNGVIQTGAVTLGKDALVGDHTVLDIWTSLGDGAQLGHSSSLHAGQSVPGGERWHGSPAQRTDVDYRGVGGTACGTLRRVVFTIVQLLNLLVLTLPLAVGGAIMLLAEVPQVMALLGSGPLAIRDWTFYLYALVASAALMFGFVVVGLLFVFTVPRVLGLAIRPDKVYPLYGFHYWAHRTIARTTNIKFFAFLFGDSSYIVHYLRGLGYDLSRVEQTGSNFGQRVKHDNPFLSSVGTGTVVADGLSIINADFSNTSFRVSRTSIGAHNFLGNNIAYPSQGRTGDNCLLATKVMVPIDGPIREGVGLLGSPSFEIPRSVQRDIGFDLDSGEQRRRLAAKNRHNLVTMALFLFVRWFYVFALTLIGMIAVDLHASWGAAVAVLANALVLLFGVTWFVLVERAVTGLQALRPEGCSIYDRSFWRHERFWKVPAQAYLPMFNGTPFKNVIWRLLGVRIGRRVFDDGCAFVEKTFVSIGDESTLNAGSIVQCHSQEDGAFKSDRTAIGAGCTLGVGAFVHYGVTMGERSVLAADSFLMKGEEMPAGARWGGNPAKKMREQSADLQVRRISIDDNWAAVLVRD
ncbi:amino acid adenylation domain-containing protein [Pseudonocardia sp. DSM 110487]|uniref:Pls/PosA family non-ribosomal peptide synthetase n=1 Tax=Pseudonocardia sp. DSM 110487 TaxID=2865833 RepID=UPI001C69A5E3|nr:Pls/PosA family non-ribosomal peptide synthetase [Pseudonocardia sp. DSM 110487]QYN34427.1 amino acid adenylation domain-containing protein [Pseudonocardia sp. DSM 110487]